MNSELRENRSDAPFALLESDLIEVFGDAAIREKERAIERYCARSIFAALIDPALSHV